MQKAHDIRNDKYIYINKRMNTDVDGNCSFLSILTITYLCKNIVTFQAKSMVTEYMIPVMMCTVYSPYANLTFISDSRSR